MNARAVIGSACALLVALVPLAVLPAETTGFPPRRFVLEFSTEVPGAEQSFQAVVGYEGRLDIVNAVTPFSKEFSAASVTIMFQAADDGGLVKARLLGERDGQIVEFGNVSGPSGKITDEPSHDCVPLSFGPF